MASAAPEAGLGGAHRLAGPGTDARQGRGDAGEAPAVELLGRAARLLFVDGQTSEAVGHAVGRLGRALGRPAELLMRWGDLTILPREGRPWRAAAEPVAVDIRRVVAVGRVIDDVARSGLSCAAALARLEAVEELPPVALGRFALMAGAGAAALSVIFGAGDLATVALVAASAGSGAALRRAVSHASRNPFAQPFLAALLAGLVAAVAARLGLAPSVRLVAVCPCMVLVPGPHLLNGGVDLARGRIPLGAARIAFAGVIVASISAGLLAGLAPAMAHLPPAAAAPPVPFGFDVAAAGVAVAAYGSFFNMPWRLLPAPVAIGMLAHAARWQALRAGADVPLAAFAACLAAGCLTSVIARVLRLPFGATSFASVVSLMPGVYMFQVASAAVDLMGQGSHMQADTLSALLGNVTTVLVILLAITAGLIAPKMVFDEVDELVGSGREHGWWIRSR